MWPNNRRGNYFYGNATYGRRGRRGGGQDSLLFQLLIPLAQQVYMLEYKPPVTLILTALNVLIFLRFDGLDSYIPSIRSGCLHPSNIILRGQWNRLLWSPLLHADEMHLYYNMVSFLWKGAQLEPFLGSIAFLSLILELAVVSGVLYVAASATVAARMSLLLGSGIMSRCAVGFSGVLFGLKVVLTHNTPGWSSVAGVALPTKYAAWAELIFAQMLVPESSFLGHLCGIVAGLLHVHITARLIGAWRRARRGNGAGGGYHQRGGRYHHTNQRFYGSGTWGS